MKSRNLIVSGILTFILFFTFTLSQLDAQEISVRNDTVVAGREVLMLRHAFLQKGKYQQWYKASRDGVWPWYEKIGTRIVGDWQVYYPGSDSLFPQNDEAWRLARYASFEHWQATRGVNSADNGNTGGHIKLGGNGDDYQSMVQAIKTRTAVQTGSKGGIFLQGYMAQTRPLYMPGVDKNNTTGIGNKTKGMKRGAGAIFVRSGASKPGQPLLTMEYFKIRKGTFEQFHSLTSNAIWPYQEKAGLRPVGHWQVIHTPASTTNESAEYDEVYQIIRYASYEHWQACNNIVTLGGNGPDFDAMKEAQGRLIKMTLESSVQFLRGPLYTSKPLYLPNIN